MAATWLEHRCVRPRPPAADDLPLPPEELSFHHVAGRPCLDLVATVGERWRRCFERLREPADLDRWVVGALAAAAAAPAAVAEVAPATDADLEAARDLRAAVGDLLFAWADGTPLPTPAVEVVNRAASRPDLAPVLTSDGGRDVQRPVTAAAALSLAARDAIDLVAHGDPGRLRECAAHDCSLLFYDASRPGRRRWCSMQGCGNRHKTTQHRRRAHEATR